MKTAIEILRVGPNGTLFQISDGERFGFLEFDSSDQRARQDNLQRPDVLICLGDWLSKHGVLIGSQKPPHLHWCNVEAELSMQRV